MAFVALTSAQCDADSPLDETLFQQIRNNFDDLNSRLNAFGVTADQAIHDEFAGTGVNGEASGAPVTVNRNWTWTLGGAGIAPAITTTDHYMVLDAGGATLGTDFVRLVGGPAKMQLRMTNTQSVSLRWRWKRSTATARFLVGLQDTGFGVGGWDTSDFIGIVSGGAATKINFLCFKGGAGTTSSDVGNDANWQIAQIDVIQTGSALSVANYLDGSQVGSTITSNIPDTVNLTPFMLVMGDGAARGVYRFDYFHAYWNAEPSAP